MLAEYKRLESQINSLQEELSDYPEGKLNYVHNGSYSKWFLSDGHKQTYISKKERPLAEKLAAKKYLSLLLEDLLHEKRAINFYLRHHNSNMKHSEQLLINMPEYKELLTPFFMPLSQELFTWSTSSYQQNPKYPEQLIHKTTSGNFVRSKSEAIIDMFLYTNRIPFRYECSLQLEESIIFPDFTIRHPKTGQIFYWEHFGLMDDPLYCKNANSKLQLYTSHGIIPSVQLITTYETRENPLLPKLVEEIIKYHFL